MKELINIKNRIIIILCITIILLGIGFSYMAMQIDFTKEKPTFNVDISKVEIQNPVQGGKNIPKVTSSITNSNKTVNLNFLLFAPRDEISAKVIIQNTGNIPATIVNLVEVPDYANDPNKVKEIYPVKLTHNDIIGKVIEPGEKIELNILAYFYYKEQAKKITVPYQISVLATSAQ